MATLEWVPVRIIAVLAAAALLTAASSGKAQRTALNRTIAFGSFYSQALRGEDDAGLGWALGV